MEPRKCLGSSELRIVNDLRDGLHGQPDISFAITPRHLELLPVDFPTCFRPWPYCRLQSLIRTRNIEQSNRERKSAQL